MLFATIFQFEPIDSFVSIAFLFIFVFVFLYFIFGNFKIPYFTKSVPSTLAVWLAVALAFVLVFNKDARQILLNITPWFAFVIIALVFLFLFLAFFGIDISLGAKDSVLSTEDRKLVGLVILAVFLFITFLAIAVQFGPFLINTSKNSQNPSYVMGDKGFANMAFAMAFNPYVFGAILFMVIAGIVVYFMTKEK